MDNELVALVLGPVIAATIAGITFVVRHWWQGHDREYRARRDLSQARDEVGFIEAWLAVGERLTPADAQGPLRQRAASDLQAAYYLAKQSTATARNRPEPLSIRRVARELLLVGLISRRGRRARVLYILTLLWALLFTGLAPDLLLTLGLTVGNVAATLVTVFVVGVAPAWGMRSFVLWVDARAVGRGPAQLAVDLHGRSQVPKPPAARTEPDIVDLRQPRGPASGLNSPNMPSS